MKNFQFQIIKYVHDQFTNEFINIGVVIYSPENQFIGCKVTNKFQRITNTFPGANGSLILKVLKDFKTRIQKLSSSKFDNSISQHLEHITSNILIKDDSAIQLSDVKISIDVDLSAALSDLFHDLVEKYITEKGKSKGKSDEDVWKIKYKKYFDELEVTKKLIKHTVNTKNDDFIFERSWKNERWHCYEPVSFELLSEDSIKDKVYKWAGKIQGIQQTNEKIHIVLLSSLQDEHKKLKKFIKSYLDVNKDNLEVEILIDKNPEEIAKEIYNEMVEHNEHLKN